MAKGKGGRVKAVWRAGVRSIGRALVHHYEGNTCTGAEFMVHMRVTLEREPDRDVSVYMSVSDARKWASALTVMADKIENQDW